MVPPVFLAVLTWWATSTIVAQTNPPKTGAPKPTGTTTSGKRPADGEAFVDQRQKDPAVRLQEFMQSTEKCRICLGSFDAVAEGRKVVISANFPILEKPPHATFLWTLRVYGATGNRKKTKSLSEQYYVNQTFHLPADQVEMSPTFKETIELEPGTYRVHVSLYKLRGNFDFSTLKTAEPKMPFCGWKKIVVPGP